MGEALFKTLAVPRHGSGLSDGSFALATFEKAPNRPTKLDVFAAALPVLDIVNEYGATWLMSYFDDDAAVGARHLFGSQSLHSPV